MAPVLALPGFTLPLVFAQLQGTTSAQTSPAAAAPTPPSSTPPSPPSAADTFVRDAQARMQGRRAAEYSPSRTRTVSDLDPQVVDFARQQMREVGSRSPAFKATAQMLAAEGMDKLDRASQIALLKAAKAHPTDADYQRDLRLLAKSGTFQDLDPRARRQVIDAFQKLPNEVAQATLQGLKDTRGDGRIHLLEQISAPDFTRDGVTAADQKKIIADTVKRENAPVSVPPSDATAKPGQPQLILEKKSRDGYTISHYRVDGVTFKLAEHADGAQVDRKQLAPMAKAINEANALIADPAHQVRDVAIHNGASRMATYQGKPILILGFGDANAGVATHESGHVVFDAMIKSFKAPPGVDLQVADIYNRLSETKSVDGKIRKTDGKREAASHPAGLWPFDPSQWSKKLDSEHPWDTSHEFFASALRAYRTDRKGVEAAITRFAKEDPAAAAPAREMLTLLDQLHAGTYQPKALAPDAEKAARAQIDRVRATTTVESTVDSALNDGLKRALQPGDFQWK